MKASWRYKLLCGVLIAALALQCSAVAFAADPYPEVYHLVGGEPDADGAWTPEYWVDSYGNRVNESTNRVRAAAELPRKYDLRDYGIVTSVKHQAGSGSCWAFSGIASLESSYILQGYGTVDNTDFSEAHLTWFSQRQRTTDTTDRTYGDGLNSSNPFKIGGNWNRVAATLMRGSGLQLEQNAPWIVTYDADVLMQMQQNESDRYVSYARMWSVTSIRDNSISAFKQKIMQNGAGVVSYYDDYTTTRTGYSPDRLSYYQTAQVGKTNHVVTVVGWDDDYPRTNFNANQRPSANGAWLIKGSWSSVWGKDGYYWISYEDPSLCEFSSFVAAPADVYDHIYQYDGAYPTVSFPIPNSGKMANVFTADRTELLTHVAFFSPNAAKINVTAEVYVAPDDFFYSGMHPTQGMQKADAATTRVNGVEYGYSTIELASPVLLTEGEVFSIVLTMERNGSNVQIPAEGEAVKDPGDGVVTFSGHIGESFLGYSGAWYDTNAYPNGVDYNNVPLKAMTRDITPTDPTLSIETAPNKTTYRVGETFSSKGLSLLYTNEYGVPQTVTEGFTCEPTALSAIGPQTVTVTYKGLSVTIDVTVEPYETTLMLLSPPNKTTYLVGETPDMTGLCMIYTDEYGGVQEVYDGYTYEPTILSVIGTQTITASYGGRSVTFDVTVEPYETTLTLTTPPDKTTYMVGDLLDTTGISLLYTDEYGMPQTVSEGFVCSPQTLRTIGTQTVTITYKGQSVTFDVTVEPYEPTLTIRNMPFKTTYFYGETLDTTGLSIVYTDEYGDALAVTEDFVCDVQTLSLFGTQTVTVTYNGLSVTFDVTVEPYEPTLTLVTPPIKTTYLYGEPLEMNGLTLLYKNEYGEEHTVTEGYGCDVNGQEAFGRQTVTVTYNALSVTFDVTIEPHEPTLAISNAPEKTTYFASEAVETAGLSLVYTDEYGETHNVTEGFTCMPETLRTLGTQTVTVTYNTLTVTFDVTVEPLEPTLTLTTPPVKTAYLIGEVLETQGMTLLYTDELGDALVVTEGFICDPGFFSAVGEQSVTVMYNELTVTFDVTVDLREPTLTILDMPEVTRYYQGDTLDTTGLTLVYSDEYGNTSVIWDDYVCESVTFLETGYQTITVTCNGLSVTFEVKVVLMDPTLEVATLPDKTTYLYGEPLDTAGLTLLYTDDFGVESTVSEGFVCTPETFSALGTQTVEAAYLGLSASFDVTVEPLEPTLTLTALPKTTVYPVGETLDPTGLTLLYTDEYGDAFVVSEGFICDPTELSVIGTQTVMATYQGLSVAFDVTVEPYEPTLTLLTPPDKTTYMVGDALETIGLSLLYTDEYNTEHTVTEAFECDPTTLSVIGTRTVTVTYNDLAVTFDVTVEPCEPTLTLVTPPDKTTYMVGDTLDTTGLSLLYTDEYNAEQTLTEGFVCSPQTLRTIGSQTVSVTYGAKSVTFDVTVEPYEPTLTLLSEPHKTTYFYGETLDTTGLSLLYTDAYNEALAVTEGYVCDVETLAAFGTRTVTVTYETLAVTFEVTVEPYEPTLTLVTPPDKTTYLYGEALDTTGLSLQYRDIYGEIRIVTEGFSCDVETPDAFGKHTVTVTYAELSVTFVMTVDPLEPTLTVVTPPDKTAYSAAQAVDTTGLSLVYTDEYGAAFTVTEGYTYSPDTLHVLGTVSVSVTYNGSTASFDVTVEPIEPTLTLQFAPTKTSYVIGETPDTTGLTLFYTDEVGDALIVTEGFTCSPDRFLKPGDQTVTVTYMGLSVTFDVTVEMSEPTLTIKTLPRKTVYFVGETLETAGLSLEYIDPYGAMQTVTEGFVCTPQTLQTSGTQTIQVSYGGLSVTFDVTVKAVVPVSLTVVAAPAKNTYTYKTQPDFSGLTVRVLYNDGHEEIVQDLSRMTVQAESDARVRRGTQTYRVTVEGVSATFSMQVQLAVWQWLILIFLFGWIWY